MFDARTHVNVDGYGSARGLEHRNQAEVSAFMALDHPFRGLILFYGEPLGRPRSRSRNRNCRREAWPSPSVLPTEPSTTGL